MTFDEVSGKTRIFACTRLQSGELNKMQASTRAPRTMTSRPAPESSTTRAADSETR